MILKNLQTKTCGKQRDHKRRLLHEMHIDRLDDSQSHPVLYSQSIKNKHVANHIAAAGIS